MINLLKNNPLMLFGGSVLLLGVAAAAVTTFAPVKKLAPILDTFLPETELVSRVQAVGSGNLRNVSDRALSRWLAKNPGIAAEVRTVCIDLERNASAEWMDSIEGRLCHAARTVNFWNFASQKDRGNKAY